MNLTFLILYELLLCLFALLAVPKTIYAVLFQKKYRKSLLARFGFPYPAFKKNSLPSIWIHSVSVGETKAVVALAKELKQQFPNNPLIISTTTETGQAEAKRSLPFADYHVYLPFDFAWVIAPIIKQAAPALVILCESDFWYNFLYYAKKQKASIVLVNGKLSEQSMKRFKIVSFFTHSLFSFFDLLCVQNLLYKERLINIGLNSEKLVVTGNLKLDEHYPQLSKNETMEWRQKLGINLDEVVLTIGSSHSPEEQLFIDALKEVWKQTPHLRVLLVPRHPERFKEVAQLLENKRLHWISFSNINRRTGKECIILIDAMGMLRMCYQLSDIALVAGSFTERVGGHNILEPCWYGKPVLFGPHMHTQVELVEMVKRYRAGEQVSQSELQNILGKWIQNPKEAQELGKNGLRLIHDMQGATTITLDALKSFSCLKALSRRDFN